MGISKEQALDCLKSTDLIGIGLEADAIRQRLHPEGIVTYAVSAAPTSDAIDNGLLDCTLSGDERSSEGQDLIDRHRVAHRSGINTAAGLIFGAGESLETRVEHLFALRALQEDAAGFTSFTPWSFIPKPGAGDPPTAVEYMRMLAVSRIVLDNIPNIESSCVAQGLKVVQMALRFGANDAGTISVPSSTNFTEEDLRRVIRDAGFKPVERDMLYQTMYLNN